MRYVSASMYCTDAQLPCSEKSTSLVEVLAAVLQRRLSGTLVFDTPSRRMGAIVVDQGVPRKVSTDDTQSRLSVLLCELGWLDNYSASESYNMALAQRAPHGQILLELRLVDEPGLLHLLTLQFIRKLAFIANCPNDTRITFYHQRDLLSELMNAPSPWSPYAIIWGVARHEARLGRPPAHRRIQSRIEDWSALPSTAATLYGLDAKEKALLQRLATKPGKLSNLCLDVGLPTSMASALVQVLDLTFPQVPLPSQADAIATGERQEPPATIEEREARLHDATVKYQFAKHLMSVGRIEQASVEISESCELDPDCPSSMALKAWIESLLPATNTQLELPLSTLSLALEREPMNLEIRFYRAQILKRLERLDEALGEWRFIVELDAAHVDALRELRLYESRRASSRPPKRTLSGTNQLGQLPTSASGLFSRFFRKSN